MVNRQVNAYWPTSANDDKGARFGDYPVGLMTRRAFGLRSPEVLEQRQTSPGQVRMNRNTPWEANEVR